MKERLDFIQSSLNDGETVAAIWWWSWLGIYSASSAGNFAIAATTDRDTKKITSTVSGVKSSLGIIGMLMNPFAPQYAPSRVRSLPTGTHEEIESSFREALTLFETAEKDTISGRSWIARATTAAVNFCAAFVIWKIYGDRIEDDGGDPRKEAMKNFLIGMISGELKIITMPKRAIGNMNEYRRRFASLSEENPEQAVRYFALPFPGGVMVGAAYSW